MDGGEDLWYKGPMEQAKTAPVKGVAGSPPAHDLRGALEIADALGELIRVQREVDPLIEIATIITDHMMNISRKSTGLQARTWAIARPMLDVIESALIVRCMSQAR